MATACDSRALPHDCRAGCQRAQRLSNVLRSRVKVFHCALLAAGQHVGLLLVQKLRGEVAAGGPSVQRELEAVREATARLRAMGHDCAANATTLLSNITSELRECAACRDVCVIRVRHVLMPHCVAARRHVHCSGCGSAMGGLLCSMPPLTLTVLATCWLGLTRRAGCHSLYLQRPMHRQPAARWRRRWARQTRRWRVRAPRRLPWFGRQKSRCRWGGPPTACRVV